MTNAHYTTHIHTYTHTPQHTQTCTETLTKTHTHALSHPRILLPKKDNAILRQMLRFFIHRQPINTHTHTHTHTHTPFVHREIHSSIRTDHSQMLIYTPP